MRQVTGKLVFKPELLFLQSMEKVFVWMAPVLFLFDESVERCML